MDELGQARLGGYLPESSLNEHRLGEIDGWLAFGKVFPDGAGAFIPHLPFPRKTKFCDVVHTYFYRSGLFKKTM